MRRRPATPPDEPLDIFEDDRFRVALAGATQPAHADAAEPPTPSPAPNPTPAPPTEELARERDATRRPRASRPAQRAARGRAIPTAADQTPRPREQNVPIRFRVPQTLRSEFQTFKAELSAALGGIALDDSNLARPLVEHFLVEHRERILEEAVAFRGQLKRPANGDAVGMAEFDHAIGEIFRRARRRRSPGRSSENTSS